MWVNKSSLTLRKADISEGVKQKMRRGRDEESMLGGRERGAFHDLLISSGEEL